MRFSEIIQFAIAALVGYRARTYLMLLAMAIGVASVILLTSLGEGARLYVINQFSSLGTNLLIVLPGRSETTGGAPPMMGGTPRDLTLRDAMAIERSRYIKQMTPLVVGSVPVSYQQRERESYILGTTHSFYDVYALSMWRGQFLPEMEMSRASPICVLGYELFKEMFGHDKTLGRWVRVREHRCRVIGVLNTQGMSIGVDMDYALIMPIASSMNLFNVNSLFRILLKTESKDVTEKAQQDIRRIIMERHDGEDDVTVLSQDSLLTTFNSILYALTYTLAGIAAVSLMVAGIMTMNVMLVAVSQRTSEIGLLKALGAPRKQILILFLTEAIFLSLFGAVLGLLIGLLGSWSLQQYFPEFMFAAPTWAKWSAMAVALISGVVFGLLPARRAADLNPVDALAGRQS